MRPGRQVQVSNLGDTGRRDSRRSRSGADQIPCSVLVDWFILLSELPTVLVAVNGRAHLFMRRRPFSYAGLRASNPVELSSIPLNTNINFGL